MESTSAGRPIATLGEIAIEHSPSGQLLLPPPPVTRSGLATTILRDRWNAFRNDMRLTVEDHMIAAPVIALAAGFLAGRILSAAFSGPRHRSRDL